MHQPKREYNQFVVPKKEEKPPKKNITCVNCGRVVAIGSTDLVISGTLSVDCPKCGTKITIQVEPKKT